MGIKKENVPKNSQAILKHALLQIMQAKRKTDPLFSQKNLAALLNVQPTALSEFFTGKRRFSENLVKTKFAQVLAPKTLDKCLHELMSELNQKSTSLTPSIRLYDLDRNGSPVMSEDQKAFTKDPSCLVLLVCFQLIDFEPSENWLQKKTHFSKDFISQRLSLMCRLGILKKTKHFFAFEDVNLEFIPPEWNHLIVDHTKATFDLALNDMKARPFKNIPKPQSVFHNYFYAINPKDYDKLQMEIKNTIRRFKRKHVSSAPSQVYALNINFFPVTDTLDHEPS